MELLLHTIVFAAPLPLFYWIVLKTRGVCFFVGNNRTDNEKMLRMAAEVRLLDWPSKMHSISYGRGQLREYWVLGLHIIQKLFKNKVSDHINIVLALLSNYISSVLLFFIVKGYYGIEVGFAVFLMYISSFWIYQVAVYMGHIHLSQAFFLASILLLQISETVPISGRLFLLCFAGAACAGSFTSSSASRKYVPIGVAGLLYSIRHTLIPPWDIDFLQKGWVYSLTLIGIFAAFTVLYKFAFKLSNDMLISYMEKILGAGRDKKEELLMIEKLENKILSYLLAAAVFCVLFVRDIWFFVYAGCYCAGLLIVALHVLLPVNGLMKNLFRYVHFLNIGKWASHFNCYSDQIAVFGRQIPKDFRGEGIRWIWKLLLRTMPVITVLYCASIVGAAIFAWTNSEWSSAEAFIKLALLLVLSILPILVTEITKGLQVGKSYMPGLTSIVFFIGYFLYVSKNYISGAVSNGLYIWWSAVISIFIINMIYSWYVLASDILPARMAPSILRNILKSRNVRDLYTYDTLYNEPLLGAMEYTFGKEFNVKFIKSISEAKEGFIVVPAVSSKSVYFESCKNIINRGDLNDDEALNALYKGNMIERKAAAKIKTMGASKIFVLESEVTSYRDLILKQITEDDRFKGNAWLLQAELLNYDAR